MVADLDMSQYLDLFVQEAEEGLATLERELLLLERAPTAERVDIVFRAAHTLKGSSRAMGFTGVADLTHEMESVLDALRGRSLQVTTEIANALLAGLDALRTRIEAIADGKGDTPSDPALVAGREVVVIRGNTVPLVRLRKIFSREVAALESSSDDLCVVVVGIANRRLGLVVDCLVGKQEVVIKSLNRFCGEVRGISGATILGDGKVALIVDVNGIVSEAAL